MSAETTDVAKARAAFKTMYRAIQEAWTALAVVEGCETDQIPISLVDHGELQDLTRRGAMQSIRASFEDCGDLHDFLKSHERDGARPTDADSTQ